MQDLFSRNDDGPKMVSRIWHKRNAARRTRKLNI